MGGRSNGEGRPLRVAYEMGSPPGPLCSTLRHRFVRRPHQNGRLVVPAGRFYPRSALLRRRLLRRRLLRRWPMVRHPRRCAAKRRRRPASSAVTNACRVSADAARANPRLKRRLRRRRRRGLVRPTRRRFVRHHHRDVSPVAAPERLVLADAPMRLAAAKLMD